MRVAVDQDDSARPARGEVLEALAQRGEAVAHEGPERIGLHQDDQPFRVRGELRGFVEPGKDRAHARLALGMPDVVVRPRHVERDENPAALLPAHVLAILAGLLLHLREIGIAEKRAPGLQPLERLLAVAPLVVARNQEEGMADARKLLLARLEPAVAARLDRKSKRLNSSPHTI